jgi:tetratricopeptide (TPR) repeat protein
MTAKFALPDAPGNQPATAVRAWVQPVVLPTYEPLSPDKNPMFLEKRVYQGSSGRVYPLPFIDRISTQAHPRSWNALHLENAYLRLMILPELGGRIHVGLDKTNGYDFFYRQNVIKPALVGLAGPWISGGVEFNWPQHHRPATFMPVNFEIEEHADGSRTIWCADHDPMNRLRGMHGVCLHPEKAIVELKVRLYNRTPLTQSFLWWANVATHVHERYQSFFPSDVHFVADHARRAMSTFPFCEGTYYGVDYAARVGHGVAAAEQPRHFIPPGNYPPNDLSWYANIPVPTSYMAIGSKYDFSGGYDHARQAGLVHVANHHIAPGKKQWTWGNHDFGYAWDRNLTDNDGPYIELMAGVYTDNQPDFSFLAPGETRTFGQYWYPIQDIGPVHQATQDAAVSLTLLRGDVSGTVRAGVYATREFSNAVAVLTRNGTVLAERVCNLGPAKAAVFDVLVPLECSAQELKLSVLTAARQELIAYQPGLPRNAEMPAAATEPLLPPAIKTNEDLYLTGLHLEQYRHATRRPETYWREALRRDPSDVRSNNAMGLWHLRRYEFKLAEDHFRRAIESLTRLNANPYDGEPYYNWGLTLRCLGQPEQAYSAFYKATWNYAWRPAAFFALAECDASQGRWNTALEHCRLCLRVNADHLNARNLSALALQQLGRLEEAQEILQATLQLDSLDPWAKHLAGQALTVDNQTRLDIAFDYIRSGFYTHALQLLEHADHRATDGSVPMLLYTLAFCCSKLGKQSAVNDWLALAVQARPAYCFPSRMDEFIVLEFALKTDSSDACASYYLGNLLYDRWRHREAITYWERAAELNPAFPTVWRNLGIGYFNIIQDAGMALTAFDKAFYADTSSARVFYERDQLWKRTGTLPKVRLQQLLRRPDLAAERDDLSVELAALYNQTGAPQDALAILYSRSFQPWEGGEGLAISQYVRAHLLRGFQALQKNQLTEALHHFEAAANVPPNLGEAVHPLANRSNIYYWLGAAFEASGEAGLARRWWRAAASQAQDFVDVSVQAYSEMTYYSARAMQRLGEGHAAKKRLGDLQLYAKQLSRQKPVVDYFATSLPAMLLFDDDLHKRNTIRAMFLQAQAMLGLGEEKPAKRLLRKILKLDPNHPMAGDLCSEIACEQHLAQLLPAAVQVEA